MSRILYLSYDGMTDPLGQSQVLPYLVGLSQRGHEITLVSCEKPERRKGGEATIRDICAKAGIDWHPLPYRKRPPIVSTLRDLRDMRRLAARLQRETPFAIVHCRSYLTALVGLWMKRRFGTAFLFDMRGYWIDERIEMGLWKPANPAFAAVIRFFRARERDFLHESDAVVSLTHAALRDMQTWPAAPADLGERTTVIPCCVDFAHFDPQDGDLRRRGRAILGLADDVPLLAYLGSLGGTYMLDEMLAAYRAWRAERPGARFLVVTQHDPLDVRAAARQAGIAEEELIVRSASRTEVPILAAAADASVAFKQPSFSALACSPTKLGELLALGVPVLANGGVGDVDEVLSAPGGAIVTRFDEAHLKNAFRRLEAQRPAPEAIRARAHALFALEDGIDRYDAIYRRLGHG